MYDLRKIQDCLTSIEDLCDNYNLHLDTIDIYIQNVLNDLHNEHNLHDLFNLHNLHDLYDLHDFYIRHPMCCA